MSRELCKHCGHAYSTTGSPNDNEGYFVSDRVKEHMDAAMDSEDFHLFSYIRKHAVDAALCPKCGQVSVDKDPPTKTCETCKYFEHEGYYRYCNKWWMSEEGSIVLPTDPLAEVVLDTPEGFGCTSHEEKEFALGMVGECTRSYLKQEKDKEDQS